MITPQEQILCVIASFLIVIAIAVWAINIYNFVRNNKVQDDTKKILSTGLKNLNLDEELQLTMHDIRAHELALEKEKDPDVKNKLLDSLASKKSQLHVLQAKKNLINESNQ